MVAKVGLILVLVQVAASRVLSLECYHCHQTTAACIDGKVDKLQTKYCNSHCVIIKYETNMTGKMVLATVRGCLNDPQFRPENEEVRKTVFHTCSKRLCNASSTPHLLSALLFCPIILFYNKLFM